MLTHVKLIRPLQTHTCDAERKHGGCGLSWKFGSSESRVPLSTCSLCSLCATASVIKIPHYRMERFYFKIYVLFFVLRVSVYEVYACGMSTCMLAGGHSWRPEEVPCSTRLHS